MFKMAGQQIFCEKCRRTMDSLQFYSSNNLEKYPNGKFRVCKKCLTMHVDNWDPDTFLPILEDADVPYLEHIWKDILNRSASSGKKLTGMTVLGKYFSQMHLSQHKKLRWKDTEAENEKYRKMMEAALEEANTTEEEKEKIKNEGLSSIPKPAAASPEVESEPVMDPTAMYDDIDIMVLEDLTEDDKKYLMLKWGKYRPSEWVRLEQLYNDMNDSYDIQGAGHKDTLKLVCKASLKSNQLLDIGDVDGAKKAVAMYDSLMKSGKFTAAQNKAENGEAIDSVGELALLCEKEEGFIPTFYQGTPNDKVDQTLEDLKRYTYNLVVREQGLGDLIESALKAMKADSEKEDLEDIEDDDTIEFDENEILEDLHPIDTYTEMQEFLEEEQLKDSESDS